MTGGDQPLALLARAVDVAGASIERARAADPSSPTPCPRWDLTTLVRHVADSAATIRQLIECGPPGGAPPPGCAAALHQLGRLREATFAGRPGAGPAALLGAYELTIHAWDIDRATGCDDELPADLVDALLVLAPLVLRDLGDRSGLFGPELPPSGSRTDTDRLLALFGRRPRR